MSPHRSQVSFYSSMRSVRVSIMSVLSVSFYLLESLHLLFVERTLIAHETRHTGVLDHIGNDLDQLREVPAVPFPIEIEIVLASCFFCRSGNGDVLDTHGECVHILLELVEQGNALDNHVVDTVNVELNLATR